MEAYCRLIDQLQEIVRENLQKIQDVSARGPNDLNTAPDVSKRIMMFESDARKIYDNLYKRSDEEDNGCKPWKKYPYYFQTVNVSILAMNKMLTHAISGGSIEIMGMLLGYHHESQLYVLDCYPLPVQGTESRVNPQNDSYEFMLGYLTKLQENGLKKEHVIGWYHSHPGFGCWLSGIDVQTQKLHQGFEDPYVAIVIDPIKSLKDGYINIGAFRTFYDGNKPDTTESSELGWHSKEYYPLDVKLFVNENDQILLDSLDGGQRSYTSLTVPHDDRNDKLTRNDDRFELDSNYVSLKVWKKMNSLLDSKSLENEKNSVEDVTEQTSTYSGDLKMGFNELMTDPASSAPSGHLNAANINETVDTPDLEKLNIAKTAVEMDLITIQELKKLLVKDVQKRIFR